MDNRRFDDLTATFARTATRRRAIGLFGAAVVGLAAASSRPTPTAAKRRKHHATCRDRKRNGRETDVDCGGGKCPRCAVGKSCLIDNDCVSGTCAGGRCSQCTPTQLCGSDANGACQCNLSFPSDDPVCTAGSPLGFTVDDCSKCPSGTEVCVTVNGLLFNCYMRCGSSD
jgi:hypothetical protein